MEWAIGIFLLVGAGLHLMAYRHGMSTKRSMLCLLCEDNDQRLKVQQLLSQAGLMHTNMSWSSSQEALTAPGTQPANELWIHAKDVSAAKTALSGSFLVEDYRFGLKIFRKN